MLAILLVVKICLQDLELCIALPVICILTFQPWLAKIQQPAPANPIRAPWLLSGLLSKMGRWLTGDVKLKY